MIKLLRTGVFESAISFNSMGRTPERTSECYEIELYVSGKGMSVIVDQDKTFHHEKGTLLFFRPGTLRYSTDHFTCFFVHLDIDEETAQILSLMPNATKVIDYAAYKDCITEIIRLSEDTSDGNTFLLQSKLYELFYMMVNNAEVAARRAKSNDNTDPRLIANAVEFIEENYRRRLTLQEIASSASLSPTYFHRVFKIHTGKTPHAFVMERRISAAKTYLLTTHKTLEDIVDLCGFSSLSYFDYNFKKHVGMTPTDFRKQKYLSLSAE